jgi:hypothetical protein
MRFCSNISASTNTGVIGVLGISSSISCRQDPTVILSALGTVGAGSARGIGILLSILSRLKGNRPLIAKPALIFFGVKISNVTILSTHC